MFMSGPTALWRNHYDHYGYDSQELVALAGKVTVVASLMSIHTAIPDKSALCTQLEILTIGPFGLLG